mmetsp:Transcript_11505/g.16262  ORF Transcript_11505/g.16262 Transcript_11505/m.16262 type:complete len:187 (-) Transcript_11505:1556-2116(-)
MITIESLEQLIKNEMKRAGHDLRKEMKIIKSECTKENNQRSDEYLRKLVHVNHKLDQHKEWISSLSYHNRRFSTKVTNVLQKVNYIAIEVNNVRASSKPDYSRLNKMFDLVDKLKEEVENHKLQLDKHIDTLKEYMIMLDDIKLEINTVVRQASKLENFHSAHQNIKLQLNMLTQEIKQLEKKTKT